MRRWLKTKLRNRAVVYTTDDHTLDGWLSDEGTDGIVLTDTYVRSDNDVHLPGDVFIPRDKVRFLQIVRTAKRS